MEKEKILPFSYYLLNIGISYSFLSKINTHLFKINTFFALIAFYIISNHITHYDRYIINNIIIIIIILTFLFSKEPDVL